MPDGSDYVDLLFPPMGYSPWWLLGALLVLLLVGAWIAGVILWTQPVEVLRGIPLVRGVLHRVLRVKFTRALTDVQMRHDRGELDARQAFHEISRIFRQFVAFRTGYPLRRMTATDITDSDLPQPVLDVLSATYPGQFDAPDPRAVGPAVETARKVVAAWN